MEQFYKVVDSGTLKLPKGLQLSTKFVRCELCKNEDFKTPVYVRCRHDPGCKDHAKKKDDPSYKVFEHNWKTSNIYLMWNTFNDLCTAHFRFKL